VFEVDIEHALEQVRPAHARRGLCVPIGVFNGFLRGARHDRRTHPGMPAPSVKGFAPPQVTMMHGFRAVAPFLLISIVVLVLSVPAVATWLPGLVG